jgi:hypothetical protein
MDKNYFINSDGLNIADILVDLGDTESCGYFIQGQKENELFPYLTNFGREVEVLEDGVKKKVGMCHVQKNKEVLWHTHCSTHNPYPSANDIISIITDDTLSEIIFTKWGIWQLTCSKKHKINGQKYKALYSYFKQCGDVLNRDGDINKYIFYIENINKEEKEIELDLKIFFSFWNDLNSYNLNVFPGLHLYNPEKSDINIKDTINRTEQLKISKNPFLDL